MAAHPTAHMSAPHLSVCFCFSTNASYLGNHTPSPHRRAPAHRDPRQDRDVPTDPAVLPDVNLLARLWALGAVAYLRVQRVGAAEQRDVRTKERACPNADGAGVDPRRVRVDKHTLAQFDLRAVVHVRRALYQRIIVELRLVGGSVR